MNSELSNKDRNEGVRNMLLMPMDLGWYVGKKYIIIIHLTFQDLSDLNSLVILFSNQWAKIKQNNNPDSLHSVHDNWGL